VITRAERVAQAEARLRDPKATLAKGLARAQAVQRSEEKKARDKRRYLVGQMADEAGLFAWSDADLHAVLTSLATLRDVPHPGAVLAGLLQESSLVVVPPELAWPMLAHGVAPLGPVGRKSS
jgi:hypothetical protein